MKQYNENLKSKMFRYFQQKLHLKKSTKGWQRGDCIYCDGKHTMGLNFHEQRLHCFKCEIHKSPIDAIMDIEHFTNYNQVIKLLQLREDFDRFDREVGITVQETKPIKLPEHYRSILTADSQVAESARNYLRKRKFNIEDLGLRGVGYCAQGPYGGYIIFPFYRKGELIFFQGRQFIPIGPKMQNPPEMEFGVGKTQVIYNEDALMMYRKVRVVESVTNALTIGESGIATLGKHLSDYQYQRIIKSPAEAIMIYLDDDAYMNGIELGMALCHYKKVKVIKMPEKIDVNDLGKRESLALERQTNYQNYNDLFRIRLNLKNEGAQYSHKAVRFNRSFGKDS